MGSFCGKVLHDLGMEVIKIEPPGGDAGRLEPPFAKGHAHREGSLRFAYLNAGKKSITLDIATDTGRKIFLDLVAKSDVVLETFAPGDLAARGLGYAQLVEKHSKLILVSLTGFGQDGPYAHYQAPDIVGNAMGALLYISGDPEDDAVQSAGDPVLLLCKLDGLLWHDAGAVAARNARHRRLGRCLYPGEHGAARACGFQFFFRRPGNETRRQPTSAQRAGKSVSVQERLDRVIRHTDPLAAVTQGVGPTMNPNWTIPSGSIAICGASKRIISTRK